MLPIIQIGKFGIYTFPIILLFAVYSCIYTLIKSKKYNFLYLYDIFKGALFVLPFVLIFGKIVFIAVNLLNGMPVPNILFGGFVFYGGLLGGCVGLIIYSKLKKESFLDFSDVYVSILPLGQAIGRIGCYLNGCCYGIEYQGKIGVNYYISGNQILVFPTWFVEALVCIVLFIIMQKVICSNVRGIYTGTYFVGYSVERFLLEYFRGDSIRGIWYGLSTSQIISVVLFILGLIVFSISIYNKKINKIIKQKGV